MDNSDKTSPVTTFKKIKAYIHTLQLQTTRGWVLFENPRSETFACQTRSKKKRNIPSSHILGRFISQVAYSDQVNARSSWRHIIIITSLVDSIPTDKRFNKLKGVTGADVTSLERKLQAKHRKENDKLDISTHG